MATTNELTEYLKGRKPQAFRPHPFYSEEGDFLTYYFKDEDCYAQRVDHILTVYVSQVSNEFVGFKLKGVKNHLLPTLGDFQLTVHDGSGRLMLSLLVLAGLYVSDEPNAGDYYRRIARQAKGIPFECAA